MPFTDPADRPSHDLVNHTGEVQLELFAPDLAGLFEEAGRALASLMLEEADGDRGPEVTISIAADDRTELLFEWINELVYRSEIEKVIFTEFMVQEVSERELTARVRGVTPRSLRTAVKAATFHNLAVIDTPRGVSATVVLDV